MKRIVSLLIFLVLFGFSNAQSLSQTSSNHNTVTLCSCPGEIWNTSSLTQPNVTFSGPGNSKRIMFSDFGFTIPNDAFIKGIEVKYDYATNATGANLQDTTVLLMHWGNIVGTDHKINTADYVGTNTISLGDPTDMWGWYWTPTDINANSFGFALKLISSQAGINYSFVNGVTLTVYYEVVNGIISHQTSNGDLQWSITNKHLSIVKSNEFRNDKIEIFDLNGKKLEVDVSITKDKADINLISLSNGAYFFTITDENNKKSSGKFIIQ